MEKRRKIFDNDGMTVEETVSVQKKNPKLKVNIEETNGENDKAAKVIKVSDVIDTFAGYLPPQASFMNKEEGECIICGTKTASSMRKLCFNCLRTHGENLYRQAKRAIAAKKQEFNF